MAATAWLVRKNQEPSTQLNGVDMMVINKDDLDSEATVLAAADAVIGETGYFDTAVIVTSAGNLDADGDAVWSTVGGRQEAIA